MALLHGEVMDLMGGDDVAADQLHEHDKCHGVHSYCADSFLRSCASHQSANAL